MKITFKNCYYILLIILIISQVNCKLEQQGELKTNNPIFSYSNKIETSNSNTFSSCANEKTDYKIEFSIYPDSIKINSNKYYKFKFDYSTADFTGFIRKDNSVIYFIDRDYKRTNDMSKDSENVLFDFKNIGKQYKLSYTGMLGGYTISLTKRIFNAEKSDTTYIFSLHPIIYITDNNYIDSINVSKKYGIQKVVMQPGCSTKKVISIFR